MSNYKYKYTAGELKSVSDQNRYGFSPTEANESSRFTISVRTVDQSVTNQTSFSVTGGQEDTFE